MGRKKNSLSAFDNALSKLGYGGEVSDPVTDIDNTFTGSEMPTDDIDDLTEEDTDPVDDGGEDVEENIDPQNNDTTPIPEDVVNDELNNNPTDIPAD